MTKKGKIEKDAKQKPRKFYYVLTVLLIGFLIIVSAFFGKNKTETYAQLAKFAPATCLGGWENPGLATMSEEVSFFSSLYNEENSAVYKDNLSPLYCGGFVGSLPPETYHTRVTLRLSWFQETIHPVVIESDAENMLGEDQEDNKENKEVSPEAAVVGSEVVESLSDTSSTTSETSVDLASSTSSQSLVATSSEETLLEGETENDDLASTTTSVDNIETNNGSNEEENISEEVSEGESTKEEKSIVEEQEEAAVEEQEVIQEEVSSEEPVSFWRFWFGQEALANNDTTLSSVSGTTSEELVDELIGEVSTTTTKSEIEHETDSPPGAQFAIKYTLDGVNWYVLGYVSEVTNDIRFELPKSVIQNLADITRLQIGVIPLIQIDPVPPVYLETLWLEVSYASVKELAVNEIVNYSGEVVPFTEIEILTAKDLLVITEIGSTTASSSSEVDSSGVVATSTDSVIELDLLSPEDRREEPVEEKTIDPISQEAEIEVEVITEPLLASSTDIPEVVNSTTTLPVILATSTKLFLPVSEISHLHGIDRTYTLLVRDIGTTTRQLWLFDFTLRQAINLTMDDVTISTSSKVGVKDRIVFWYNHSHESIYAYDLRTAGTLHLLNIVANLPVTSESRRFVLPFTTWELVDKVQEFAFYSRETGEVFSDENLVGVTEFLSKFKLFGRLNSEEVDRLGVAGLWYE